MDADNEDRASIPDLTVIVAIQDARGQAEACIRRLSCEQTLPRDDYELVVVGHEELPNEGQLEEMLAPGDQIVRHPSPNEFLLYNLAAERARGRVLFFIEAHVVAEPDCLERILDFLRFQDVAGASVRSIPVTGRPFADSERQMFECAHLLADPAHFFTVLIHGFAIEKEAFELAGGFDHRYGEFSAMALSATLHSLGLRIGYATDAAVRHQYGMSMREVFSYVRDFTEGEMRFRETEAPERVARYLDDAVEWVERRSFEPATAARLARASGIVRRKRGRRLSWWEWIAARLSTVRLRVRARLGLRHALAAARLGVGYRWALALLRKGGAREYSSYLRWWEEVIGYSRLRYLDRRRRSYGAEGGGGRRPDVAVADDRHLVGFHAREEWLGRLFRWSSELSAVELELSPGRYRVSLDVLPIAPPDQVDAAILLFDETPIDVSQKQGTISFELEPRMFGSADRHWLFVGVDPIPAGWFGSGEQRRLGLPISGLKIRSAGEWMGSEAPPEAAPEDSGQHRAVDAQRFVASERADAPGREPANARR